MEIVALFDGDVIAYRGGFAAEKRVYFDKRLPPGKGGRYWGSKKEVALDVPEEHIDSYRKLEPLENGLQNAKSLINNAVKDIEQTYPGSEVSYLTFVSGNKERENFRKAVDPLYKAHRKAEHRPTYLPDLLEYLLQYHNGFATEGCEADDFFGHAQSDARKQNQLPIVVSVDKDLKQLHGMHYDLVKKVFEEVSPGQADLVFWRQMLQGDAADNITGITGVGAVKAKRYLPDGTDNQKAQEIVCSYYQREYEDGWKEPYNKNAQLLWIWRTIPDQCPFTVQEAGEEGSSTLPQ